ncbi:tetratricopeptide repeat protein [Actinoplanes sp. NPDC051343]|uniref:tetratricopeptide repeat protein n=1 Tax=Actinoplanes sp. NPDC051343 TaxID=3363906 RepID=UPI0037A05258
MLVAMSSDGSQRGRSSPRPLERPRLPAGPLNDLKSAIYQLYLDADTPTLDEIEGEVGKLSTGLVKAMQDTGVDEDAAEKQVDVLEGAVPRRDTIKRIIASEVLPPGRADTVAVAVALARMSGRLPDQHARRDLASLAAQVRRLWDRARTVPAPQPARLGRPVGPGTAKVFADISVAGSRYLLENFREEATPLPAGLSPSWLLAAQYEVVGFAGRDTELRELGDWRDAPTPAMTVKLVHGPGGQGKTRLVAQFAAASQRAGWRVVAARRTLEAGAAGAVQTSRWSVEQGVLLIVDYAERWPDGHLVTVLNDPSVKDAGGRVRVLLLARPGGAWWQGDSYRLGGGVLVDTLPLLPLADSISPEALFDAAVTAFAGALGAGDIGRLEMPPLADEDRRLVLTIHMAALVCVDAYLHNREPYPRGALPKWEDFSAYLLGREFAHWQELHASGRISTSVDRLARTVFVATLIGPLGYAAAVAALERAGVASADLAVVEHRVCYPPAGSAPEQDAGPQVTGDEVLEPLYPDRLGEDFIALSTPGHDNRSVELGLWAPDVLAHLLEPGPGEGVSPYAQATITVLVEVARRWRHIAENHLYPLLRLHPQVAVAAGSATLIRLAGIEHMDFEALRQVESQLPAGPHIQLDTAHAAITVRLVEHDLTTETDDRRRASLFYEVASRLLYAGQYEKSLEAAEQVVTIVQGLADDPRSDAFLASALDLEGVILAAMGHRDKALFVGERSAELLQQCVNDGQTGLERHLANVLTNISARYPTESFDRALDCATRALVIRRAILSAPEHDTAGDGAGCQIDQDRADLGRALHNLADVLYTSGRYEQALPHSAEDVGIFEELHGRDLAQWKPDLARGLYLASLILLEHDPGQEAATYITRAVQIYGDLSVATRDERNGHRIGHLVDRFLQLNAQDSATIALVWCAGSP